MTIQELVEEFAKCVSAQSDAIERGNAKLGNRYAARYIKAFQQLRLHGDEGRNALTVLLSDMRADVRVMAAAFLLRHRSSEARTVLEVEARGTGMVAFEAEEALRRWTDGTWLLDLEPDTEPRLQ